jgi:hypothetical protein
MNYFTSSGLKLTILSPSSSHGCDSLSVNIRYKAMTPDVLLQWSGTAVRYTRDRQ